MLGILCADRFGAFDAFGSWAVAIVLGGLLLAAAYNARTSPERGVLLRYDRQAHARAVSAVTPISEQGSVTRTTGPSGPSRP